MKTYEMKRIGEKYRENVIDTIIGTIYVNFYKFGVIPFYELKKYIADTFKPYKTRNQEIREWKQMVTGLSCLGVGLRLCVRWPLLLVVGCLIPPLGKRLYASPYTSYADYFTWLALNLIFLPFVAVSHILKGLLQIVTAPFTILIRKPLRHLITAMKGKQQFEDNPGLVREVKELARELSKENKNSEIMRKCTTKIVLKSIKASGGEQPNDFKTESLLGAIRKVGVVKSPGKSNPDTFQLNGETSDAQFDEFCVFFAKAICTHQEKHGRLDKALNAFVSRR